jgi:hypothetical protein
MGAQLTRWDGLIAMVTGVLLMLWWLLVTTLLPSLEVEVDLAVLVGESAWVPYSLLGMVGTILLPGVIVSLYVYQKGTMTTVGQVGFYLSLLGTVMFAWVQIQQTLVWPVLLDEAPQLVDNSGPLFGDALFATVYWSAHGIMGIGFILFGRATARGRAFPRWAGILLAFGGAVVGLSGLVLAMRFVGVLALGPALIWMGFLQWRDRGAGY